MSPLHLCSKFSRFLLHNVPENTSESKLWGLNMEADGGRGAAATYVDLVIKKKWGSWFGVLSSHNSTHV